MLDTGYWIRSVCSVQYSVLSTQIPLPSIQHLTMSDLTLKDIAERFVQGRMSVDEFVGAVASSHSAELGNVTLDLDRTRRCGFPEVIFGEGKPIATLEKIFQRLLNEGTDVLATRISQDKAERIIERFPVAAYNDVARTIRISNPAAQQNQIGDVAVVTAGTSDLPIAEEARETLDWMGVAVTMIHDVGVAGPHRLPKHLDKLQAADAVVVIAGMEGALPSVVGGYVACPVIAVPTSVGYGASFGGVAALLGMLNSCSSNVTVVNIDAGFKGGYVAGLIARRAEGRDAA